MAELNARAVEDLVLDDLAEKIDSALDRNLSSQAKALMAWEDLAAIRDVLVELIIAPYVLEVASSPHRVMLAALAPKTIERPR